MTNIIKADSTLAINGVHSFAEMMQLCEIMAESGMVPDAYKNNPAAILAAAKMGERHGWNVIESCNCFAVIKGTPSLNANAQRALVRRAGHEMSYEISDKDDWVIARGKRADTGETAQIKYSMADAHKAGLVRQGGNWAKYPRAMLKARATSELVRDLFSDVVTLGAYVPEEIGAKDYEVEPVLVPAAQGETASLDTEEIAFQAGEEVVEAEIVPEPDEAPPEPAQNDSEEAMVEEFVIAMGEAGFPISAELTYSMGKSICLDACRRESGELDPTGAALIAAKVAKGEAFVPRNYVKGEILRTFGGDKEAAIAYWTKATQALDDTELYELGTSISVIVGADKELEAGAEAAIEAEEATNASAARAALGEEG